MARKPKAKKQVEALSHNDESRLNIPTAELESVMPQSDKNPVRVAYQRRNRDLDPQLVWRGKDEQDQADLVVQAPPLYIQEKVHPKVLIDDLSRESRERAQEEAPDIPDLFADFNGLPNLEATTEFYQHDQNWSNRMILGDSLQVMASLAEREGLRGKVQCIYMDPPYGIKFNSNFQWSTTSRDVRDGKKEHITREPEQVKAFRDTWRDGIHSYLSYLRDRLTVARELLTDSGSIFVQIGDENVHRVRAVMDEVFGEENFLCQISTRTSGGSTGVYLSRVTSFVIWYSRNRDCVKFRRQFKQKDIKERHSKYARVRMSDLSSRSLSIEEKSGLVSVAPEDKVYRQDNLTSQSIGRDKGEGASSWFAVELNGRSIEPSLRVRWKTNRNGMRKLVAANRVEITGNSLAYVRYFDDFRAVEITDLWEDVGGVQSRTDPKVYVVQSPTPAIQRCVLMATDPGDLVLDPTCGSGTTAYVAEQWGRRWITIDTSRVALALARARIMGARYSYYLLADSRDGKLREAEVSRSAPSTAPTLGQIHQGFVYQRVPHVTLKSITSNAQIDVVYERLQPAVDLALADINRALYGHEEPFLVDAGGREGTKVRFDAKSEEACRLPSGERVPVNALLEWEIPRELPADWPDTVAEPLARFWEARKVRQREIDASIASHADFEFLYDKPYEDRNKVRVAGPFTVESLTPHRIVEAEAPPVSSPSEHQVEEARGEYTLGEDSPAARTYDFTAVILEQLRSAGVQQADRRSKIEFTSLTGWPGKFICAEGHYREGEVERRAGILIGPEHGTVGRADLIAAAREAGDAGFDVLIGCAFNYDAQSTDTNKLGRLPILKARMNADLHMSTDLKQTKGGNLVRHLSANRTSKSYPPATTAFK